MRKPPNVVLPPINPEALGPRKDYGTDWQTPKTAMSFWGEYGRSPRFNQVGKMAQMANTCLGVVNNVWSASMKTLVYIAILSETQLRAQYHTSSADAPSGAFAEYHGERQAEPSSATIRRVFTW